MSLKGFHIFFIVLSIMLAAGCAAWSFVNGVALVFGVMSCLTGVGLGIYGVYFIRKSRKLIV
jgi:hypothetical protein